MKNDTADCQELTQFASCAKLAGLFFLLTEEQYYSYKPPEHLPTWQTVTICLDYS